MRIRTIKPEFCSSFSIATLSEPAVILAACLLCHADDRGYFEADPRIIKANIFPLREPSRSIPGMLMELSGIDYIRLREAPNGRLVGFIVNFERHQVINKPSKTLSKAEVDFGKGSEAQAFATQNTHEKSLLHPDSGSAPVGLPEHSRKNTAGTGNREGEREEEPPISPVPGDSPAPASPKSVREKGPLQLRAEALMRRKPSTPLTVAEQRAFTKNRPAIQATTEEDWQALEAYYAVPQSETFARKDLAALLNNWNGEIDRAKSWLAEKSAAAAKPASLWELQQREKAIRERMRDLDDRHQGQKYVGLKPGSTNPYEWTPEGLAEFEKLKAELATVRARIPKAE